MDTANQKAICILGMHRSGTSAIARAVNLLGAYIGRPDRLMPPKEDNPDGFWEHIDIYSFHERLLKALSRSWDSVMPMPEEWWKKPEVAPYRQELINLILREFEGQPLWMWKDPRTSLLLPLWREVLQELKIDASYILCIRNPLDVAASLKRRDDFSKLKSLVLWHLHNVSSGYWTEGCKRAVICYDHFLEDWEGSLKKIAVSLDIAWPKNDNLLRSTMANFIKPSSRHSHSDLGLLMEDKDVPEPVVSFYRLLMDSEKNPGLLDSEEGIARLNRAIAAQETPALHLKAIIEEKDVHIENLNERLSDQEQNINNLELILQAKQAHIENIQRQQEENYRDWQAHEKNLNAVIEDRTVHIKNLEHILQEKETLIAGLERQQEENYRDRQAHEKNLNAVIEDRTAHIKKLEHILGTLETAERDKEARIGGLENSLKDKEAILNRIYHSYGLGALWVCNKMVDNLFPPNSKRRLFSKLTLNSIRNLKSVIKIVNKKNLKTFIRYVRSIDPKALKKETHKIIFREEIRMYCDVANLEPESVEVAGWAISPKGIKKVKVYCDDILIGDASYGQPRPDVRAVYPFIENSEKSGFFMSALFHETLSPGHHTLSVKAHAGDGREAELKQLVKVTDAYPRFLLKMTPDEGTLLWMWKMGQRFSSKPSINLAMIAKEEDSSLLRRSIDSILAQSYPYWSMTLFFEKDPRGDVTGPFQALVDEKRLNIYPVSEVNQRLSRTKSDFLGFVCPGDFLAPHALFEMVKRLNLDEGLDLLYADEDRLKDGRRETPFFKPDWSPDLLLSMNYIGPFFLLRRELFNEAGSLTYGASAEGLYDLLLRVTERTQRIGHIPLVLHTRGTGTEPSYQVEKRILEEALIRREIEGEVIPLSQPGTYRVKRKILNLPKVTIIILTAYKNPDLFSACLRSVVEKSSYKNYEVLLMDNSHGSLPLQELEQLIPEHVPFRTVQYKEAFNFSHMNNLAAEQANGDFLIFLNDDTGVIAPEWIEAMLEQAQRPEVGVVGAKLLYQNETVQHAGIFLTDIGGAGRHAFRFGPRDAEGYQGFLGVTRNCSGVTFACIMVSKKTFLSLGGLDENLRVECNDTDFCLRAIEKGYLVVWTPFALLYHRELTTRIRTNFPDDISFFWRRWRHLLEKGDPYYNPNLTLDSDHFSYNTRPVIIAHHEPYLPRASEIKNGRSPFIDSESIRNILVMKLDHLGDFILGLPAIKMIRDKFPRARITLLGGTWTKPIAEKVSEIDHILTFNFFHEKSEEGKPSLPAEEIEQLERLLRSYHFDLAIDLRRHPDTRKILKLSGARYTVGYDTKEEDDWLTISLRLSEGIEDIAAQDSKPHITAQMCQLVQAIAPNSSASRFIEIPMPALSLHDQEITDILRGCSGIGQTHFRVGIHPGVGSSIRQWPVAYFARLANMLIEREKAQIILFGGKGEAKLASEILDQIHHKDKVISLAGEISLEEFFGVVKHCHLFIGNVSGPCHIAGAMGVPTLTIFAGQVLPHEWHPLGDKTMSVRVGVPCSPCYKSSPEQCPHDLKCLKFLWPEKVYEAALQLITISRNLISECTPLIQAMASMSFESDKHPMVPPRERDFVGDGDFAEIGAQFLKYFISLSRLKPNERILDVGCGIGRIAIPLTQYLNKDAIYEGFDVVRDGINWCTENISPRYPNFRFQLADLFNKSYNPHGIQKAVDYRFPYANDYFDFVFLTSVFTHMLPQDMENYLHEIWRVLRNNGRCFITFFILNNESRKQIRDGNSTQNFRYRFKYREEEYLTIDQAIPEAAVAFDEMFIRTLYERTDFEIVEPIHYGSWSGRSDFLSYQDIIIACKKKNA